MFPPLLTDEGASDELPHMQIPFIGSDALTVVDNFSNHHIKCDVLQVEETAKSATSSSSRSSDDENRDENVHNLNIQYGTSCDENLSEQVNISTSQSPPALIFSDDELTELELLRDQEIDTLVNQGFITGDDRWNIQHRDGFKFTYPELVLSVITGDGYPVKPLLYEVTNVNLPRIVVDALRTSLRPVYLADIKANSFHRWVSREFSRGGYFEAEMAVLHLAAKTKAHVLSHRELANQHRASTAKLWKNQSKHDREEAYDLYKERKSYLQEEFFIRLPKDSFALRKEAEVLGQQKISKVGAQTDDEVLENSLGLDLLNMAGNEFAQAALNKTPAQICEQIPAIFRVLRLESIIRKDLFEGFLHTQSQIRQRLLESEIKKLKDAVSHDVRREAAKKKDERNILVDHLIQPRLTFHGTSKELIPLIVEKGFRVPKSEQVRCGSTYGRGIYTSPVPEFSLSYTGYAATPNHNQDISGLKLIACATVMGISQTMYRTDNWRKQTKPYPGADSHVANGELEYIVFNKAQSIPVYIIHLDLGPEITQLLKDAPDDPIMWEYKQWEKMKKRADRAKQMLNREVMDPGERKRQKEALLSKAKKYFPYGFGAAIGASFLVEEIGEVSEDDEEYGEYQKDRLVKRIDGSAPANIWDADDYGLGIGEVGNELENKEDGEFAVEKDDVEGEFDGRRNGTEQDDKDVS